MTDVQDALRKKHHLENKGCANQNLVNLINLHAFTRATKSFPWKVSSNEPDLQRAANSIF
ncbi:MAG: hypothetical protein ACJAU0_002150 [Flavobacteriales bacterium]|jgi:hypothetical protein